MKKQWQVATGRSQVEGRGLPAERLPLVPCASPQWESGFSLVEMVVVVTVALIIAAMAFPSVLNTVRRYQLENSARNVQGTLLRARYEAVRQNKKICTIYVPPAPPNPPEFGLDTNCNGTLDPNFLVPLSTQAQIVATGEPDTATMGAAYAPTGIGPLHGMTPIGNSCNTSPASPTFGSVGTIVQNPGVACPVTGAWAGSFIEANTVYVVFLRHNVSQQWAAVTVTPVGRVRVWFWNGTSWGS